VALLSIEPLLEVPVRGALLFMSLRFMSELPARELELPEEPAELRLFEVPEFNAWIEFWSSVPLACIPWLRCHCASAWRLCEPHLPSTRP
jgi:hypothetical protein